MIRPSDLIRSIITGGSKKRIIVLSCEEMREMRHADGGSDDVA